MRTLVVVLGLLLGSHLVWAKEIKIPKGSINVNQLHNELLDRFPGWRGMPQADGAFLHPLLGVEHTAEEILLTVPDDANEAAIQSVVAAHTPQLPVAAKNAQQSSDITLEERVSRLERLVGQE